MSFIRCLVLVQPRKTGNCLDMIEGLLVQDKPEPLCCVFYPLLSTSLTKEDRKLSGHDQRVASSRLTGVTVLCLLSAA